MNLTTWENDDVIEIKFNKEHISHYNKNCWRLGLRYGVQQKMNIEFDDKLLTIDTYYSISDVEKYFHKKYNATILLHQHIDDVSSKNDSYYQFKENTNIDDVINNGNGLFLVKDGYLYFSIANNTNPNKNNFKYGLIIYFIQSQTNNVSDNKFTFGLNWLDFVKERINDTIVEDSMVKIKEWFSDGELLKDKSIIDIGCGSGLHSLNLLRLGKSITSIDIDKNCIEATKILQNKYNTKYNLSNWNIQQISVLDDHQINSLGKYDVVYSWGVLHHTGNMWKAIENATKLCKENGIFFISLYSVYKRYKKTLLYKIKFNNASKFEKIKMIADRVMLAKYRQKDSNHWNRLTSRGMNVFNDIVDWCGGYPYEVATTELILKFLEPKGFRLIKKNDPPNKACHEWMFIKIK